MPRKPADKKAPAKKPAAKKKAPVKTTRGRSNAKTALIEEHGEDYEQWPVDSLEELITPRARHFVHLYLGKHFNKAIDAYCESHNVSKDYKYAKQSAHRVKTNPIVAAYIKKHSQHLADMQGMTEEWIMSNIKSLIERCMQFEVVKDPNGEPIGEFQFDATNARLGLQLAGQYHTMWKEKREHAADDDLKSFIQGISNSVQSNPMAALQAKHNLTKQDDDDSGASE
jgi:hypothetical protein